jgi:hypothetical protein
MTNLLTIPALTTAVALNTQPFAMNAPPLKLTIQANFIYGSGGTSFDAYVQTSIDGGLTWCDVANFHFTTSSARKLFNLNSQTPVTTQATPTDGSLTANTSVDGITGALWRVKYASVGTYAGATAVTVDVSADQAP